MKRIIPCLDVKDGQVVKGIKFKDLKKAGDPLQLAEEYEREGAHELVFLDISATTEGRGILLNLLKTIGERLTIPLIAGGGISTLGTIESLLAIGVDKVSVNTAGVKNPSLIEDAVKTFGGKRLIVAIDAKRRDNSWEVMINGGEVATGKDVLEWAKRLKRIGVKEILLTSMDSDGTKEGYDTKLCREVHRESSLSIIASGGAGHPEHLYEALTEGEAQAVLLASILHYREYSISSIREYLLEKGVELANGIRSSLQ